MQASAQAAVLIQIALNACSYLSLLRPNVLMFGDWSVNFRTIDAQREIDYRPRVPSPLRLTTLCHVTRVQSPDGGDAGAAGEDAAAAADARAHAWGPALEVL